MTSHLSSVDDSTLYEMLRIRCKDQDTLDLLNEYKQRYARSSMKLEIANKRLSAIDHDQKCHGITHGR